MNNRLNLFLSRCRPLVAGAIVLFAAVSASAQEAEPRDEGAANNGAEQPRAVTVPDLETQQQQHLAEEVAPESLVWLNAAGNQFLALWEPHRNSNPFGAILIVHGEGQTADWPYTIHAARQTLPDYGWSTLSISLPDPPDAPIPSRSGSEAPPDGTDQSTENEVAGRLQAAMDYLNGRGQYNIVVLAHGKGASRAVHYLSTLTVSKPAPGNTSRNRSTVIIDRPVRALIMVNARNELPAGRGNLKDFFTDSALPVLDVYFGDHLLDQTEPDERKLAAKRNRLENYHQIRLLAPTVNWQGGENRLTRRVRGFLNKYAKGVELN